MTWPVSTYAYGSYEYLLREVCLLMHYGADHEALNHDQFGLVDSLVQRGVRRFYTPPRVDGRRAHEWSFLRPATTITTTASYDTGTIAIASGVVTLTSGTFPAAAASGELTVDGVTYTVNTRDSNTQITLDDTSVTVSSGTSYVLGFPQLDLPSDFAMFEGPITYRPGDSGLYGPIEMISEHTIRSRRQTSDYYARPQVCAYRPKSLDPTAGTSYEILFWPTPDDAYVLDYRYKVNPGLLTTTNLYPYGGDPHAHTWVEAVLAEAEAHAEKQGVHAARFLECLQSSVDHDQRVNSPDFLGYNGDRSDVPIDSLYNRDYHRYDQNRVSYEGTVY